MSQIESLGMKNILVRSAELTPEQNEAVLLKGSHGLLDSDAERISASASGIAEVAALREVKATLHAIAGQFVPMVLEVTPNLLGVQELEVQVGRFLAQSDLASHALTCVLGAGLAHRLGAEGALGATLRLEGRLYRVVGVLGSLGRRSGGKGAVSSRDFAQAMFIPFGSRGRVTELIAASRSVEGVVGAATAIRRVMEVVHRGAEDYRIVVPQELLRQAEHARSTFDILLGSIGVISLLIGGIGIMNVMLANVAERTYEIGLRRALGATKEAVLAQFLIEAVVLTGVGGALGVILGLGGLLMVSSLVDWAFCVTPFSLFVPLTLSVALGLAFGLYPALKASRLDPAQALR